MLSCADYDYIEIVCMHNYPVQLSLKSGVIVEGIAVDTVRDKERQECIKLDVKGQKQVIVLDNIISLKVMVENPHLQQVTFAQVTFTQV